jgi:hypothetical protein
MTSEPPLRFDDSLKAFAAVLVEGLGVADVQAGVVLRDVEGRLAFAAAVPLDPDRGDALRAKLQSRLGVYARGGGRSILDPDSPGAESIREDRRISEERFELATGSVVVRVLDRRLVGSDWLTPPAPGWTSPPARMVFASMKGGVGRSTALAVLAADLSRSGAAVLVLDLDLEAPGLGEMILASSDRPRFGALDWYVETGLGVVEDEFLEDLVAPSTLCAGNGLVDVVPAVGAVADSHPGNVLAKLSRAYLGGAGTAGPTTFLDQTRSLIDRLLARRRYDAVLVDARAGLNETTAASVLGLGADVLLFGVDTPQTFAAHRYLLAHLSRFPRDSGDADWLSRLKVVHAKAPADPDLQKRFRDRAFGAFDELAYRDGPLQDDAHPEDSTLLRGFGLEDPDAPHHAWVVLSDANYFQFDPIRNPTLLAQEAYRGTFHHLVTSARERLDLEDLR